MGYTFRDEILVYNKCISLSLLTVSNELLGYIILHNNKLRLNAFNILDKIIAK